jgi:hypothetical protein
MEKIAHLSLTKEQDAAILSLCDTHAKLLGFRSVASLIKQTGNSEVALRLLLAHHRRLRDIVRIVEDGKASLPTDG